jgi:hypothetical protein
MERWNMSRVYGNATPVKDLIIAILIILAIIAFIATAFAVEYFLDGVEDTLLGAVAAS